MSTIDKILLQFVRNGSPLALLFMFIALYLDDAVLAIMFFVVFFVGVIAQYFYTRGGR